MTEPHQSDTALAAHLHALEEQLLAPAVRRDAARLDALLAHDFVEIGASGRVWSRAEIIQQLAHESYTPPAVEDFRCSLLAPTVALLTWRSVRTDAASGTRTSALRSSVWILNEKVWRLRFHQGTAEN